MNLAASAFPIFFAKLLKRYGGSKQELAKELGIAASSVSQYASGDRTPGVELCFQLAAATGVSVLKILREAGKGDVAHLVEQLFGEAPSRRIDPGSIYSSGELELLAKLRLVRPRSRRALQTLIKLAAENGAYQILHGPPGSHLVAQAQRRRRPEVVTSRR